MRATILSPLVPWNPSHYISLWPPREETGVTIRPIRPEDEPLIVKFHESISDRTVHMRYFC